MWNNSWKNKVSVFSAVIGSQIDQLLLLRSSWDPLKTQLVIQSSSSEGWRHMGHTQQVTQQGHRSLLPPLPSARPCRSYALTNSEPVDSLRIEEGHTKGRELQDGLSRSRRKRRWGKRRDRTLSITTQMSYCHGDAKLDKRGRKGKKRVGGGGGRMGVCSD